MKTRTISGRAKPIARLPDTRVFTAVEGVIQTFVFRKDRLYLMMGNAHNTPQRCQVDHFDSEVGPIFRTLNSSTWSYDLRAIEWIVELPEREA